MKSIGEVKTFFRNAEIGTNADQDKAVLADAIRAGELKSQEDVARIQPSVRRLIMKNPLVKLAAAAILVIAVLAGLRLFSGESVTFARVIEPFLTARTATFEYTVSLQDGPSQTGEAMFMAPAHIRRGRPGETIVVGDLQQGRMVVLIPVQNRAIVYELKNVSEEPGEWNLFLEIRRRILEMNPSPDESVQPLGTQQIEGKEAIGYRVEKPGMSITVWADAESLLPIQIESATGPLTYSMSHIAFDVELDESLFSTEIPAGYSVTTMEVDGSDPEEKDLIDTFRTWAEHADGRFPSTLDASAPEEFMSLQGKKMKESGQEPSEDQILGIQKIIVKMSRGGSFVQQLPAGSDWHYAGQDAVLGEVGKAIFWYRPAGSATYRVIYADLSVHDVAAEDLPK
ncbi:MAG: LolA family protein [Solirubrobacterales bacterium]